VHVLVPIDLVPTVVYRIRKSYCRFALPGGGGTGTTIAGTWPSAERTWKTVGEILPGGASSDPSAAGFAPTSPAMISSRLTQITGSRDLSLSGFLQDGIEDQL